MKKTLLLALCACSVGMANAQTDSTATTNGNEALIEKVNQLQTQVNTLEEKEAVRTKNEYDEKIWKRKKYLTIGFNSQKMKSADDLSDMSYKSKFGMTINMGRTYYLHRKAIANILKIGLDWTWFNIDFAKYKSGNGIHFNTGAIEGDYVGTPDGGSYKESDGYDDDYASVDLGVWQANVGMGFGPSVHIAPFYNVGKGWQHLKAHLYFHVTPSYTAVIESLEDDNETKVRSGYTTFFNFGADISYKCVALGYECRWGKSKMKTMSFSEDDEDDTDTPDVKQKLKFPTSTFYLRFYF